MAAVSGGLSWGIDIKLRGRREQRMKRMMDVMCMQGSKGGRWRVWGEEDDGWHVRRTMDTV